VFYPRKVLRADRGSVTMGEHVRGVNVVQEGKNQFFVKTDYINLPADHIFYDDKLTLSGIFTLAHEYGHFPKPLLLRFAARHNLTSEQAEELMADILSAKLSLAMGFPINKVMLHFSGREIVYGGFPFRKYILGALQH
jgi:hypothetical protein